MKSALKSYIKEFLNEGKHDQNIYKCVIVLGPAGVGKSTAIRKIVAGTGLKYLNSDQFLEMDIEKDISKSGNQVLMKDKNRKAKWMNNPENEEKFDKYRKRAGRLNDKRLESLISRRMGIVLEGTASSEKSYEWYHNNFIKPLRNIGYDILIVGIYAPLHICMKRNKMRGKEGGRRLSGDQMKSIFYGFVDEYYEIITKASADLYEAKTILNTEFDEVTKSQISNYVHMINHPNTINRSRIKVLNTLNDALKDAVPKMIEDILVEIKKDSDITPEQLTAILANKIKSNKQVSHCMFSLRIYQDMEDHNDKEQYLILGKKGSDGKDESIDISKIDSVMRKFLNKKVEIDDYDDTEIYDMRKGAAIKRDDIEKGDVTKYGLDKINQES